MYSFIAGGGTADKTEGEHAGKRSE
jgi:hypothetical protein